MYESPAGYNTLLECEKAMRKKTVADQLSVSGERLSVIHSFMPKTHDFAYSAASFAVHSPFGVSASFLHQRSEPTSGAQPVSSTREKTIIIYFMMIHTFH